MSPAVEARARIAELRAAGKGWPTVARVLNAEQVPTPSGHGRWYPTTVRRHLDPEPWAAYIRAYRSADRGMYRRR